MHRDGGEATIGVDGSCRVVDELDGIDVTWSSTAQWTVDWLTELAAQEWGPAHDFIDFACDGPIEGVVDALATLAEAVAADEDLLATVGAGPLEDLISHSGNGLAVLDDVERVARQIPAFRAALSHTYLGPDVPDQVKARLGGFGVLT